MEIVEIWQNLKKKRNTDYDDFPPPFYVGGKQQEIALKREGDGVVVCTSVTAYLLGEGRRLLGVQVQVLQVRGGCTPPLLVGGGRRCGCHRCLCLWGSLLLLLLLSKGLLHVLLLLFSPGTHAFHFQSLFSLFSLIITSIT